MKKHFSIILVLALGLLLGAQIFAQKTADVGGAKISYELRGRGRTVVLIHGGLADSRVWDEQFKPLAKRFRVLRYDLRGYGKSDFPQREFSHVDDLYALLKFLKIEKASLVGLSIGGVIAADFALAHPEMVDKLIFVSAGLRGDRSPVDAETIAVYKAVQAGEREKAIDLWLDNPLFSTVKADPALAAKTRLMLADNYKYWAAVEKPVPVRWPKELTIDHLAEIKAPSLVVVGDRDAPHIRSIAETLNQKIAGARKIVVAGASHHLNLEKPEEFNRLVTDFLAPKDSPTTKKSAASGKRF
ncbi:MAG: alpha/beta hydrolase [Acidobacteria bacterium]|nr:alpha/beta hydrolase [Acidobacteriota bacterium]